MAPVTTAAAPRMGRPGPPPGAAPKSGYVALLALKLGALRRALFAQSPAFWCITLYVFFEYVRPQSIYGWMDVAPWPFLSLMGALVFCLLEQRFKFSSLTLWAMIALFTLVIIASSITAFSPEAAWAKRQLWINWILLMLVVGAGIRTRTEYFLFFLSFMLWNLKMSQHGGRAFVMSGFSAYSYGVGGAPGWFQNSGEFGIQMCIFLPLVGYLTYGLWPHLSRNAKIFSGIVTASALFSIIAGSSRGALLGAGVVAIWIVLRSPHRLRATVIVSVLSALTWLLVPQGTRDRLNTMGDDRDSQRRLTYWADGIEIAGDHPLLGVGYKNWIPYYHTYYDPTGELPHNFAIEAVAELGYIGLATLTLMFIAFFVENARTRRRLKPGTASHDRMLHSITYGLDGAMIGFMASGAFVSVLWYPYIWMNLALCLALTRVSVEHVENVRRQLKQHATNAGVRRQRFAGTLAPGRT